MKDEDPNHRAGHDRASPTGEYLLDLRDIGVSENPPDAPRAHTTRSTHSILRSRHVRRW